MDVVNMQVCAGSRQRSGGSLRQHVLRRALSYNVGRKGRRPVLPLAVIDTRSDAPQLPQGTFGLPFIGESRAWLRDMPAFFADRWPIEFRLLWPPAACVRLHLRQSTNPRSVLQVPEAWPCFQITLVWRKDCCCQRSYANLQVRHRLLCCVIRHCI